jgi:ribulose-5-phosphate 4-epimerase/fuculose-1-phosphate aldolase
MMNDCLETSDALRCRPVAMRPEEWRLRLQLAASYRVLHHLGWTEFVTNHLTVRVPATESDGEPCYLINPYGLHYGEVTATNLVKVDAAGGPVDGPSNAVNPAGFLIHSAIHRARQDAHCIMHTHTLSGMAVACKEAGLRHDNFYTAMLYGRVAYHAFEGITTDDDEAPRLVESLGDKDVLILRNHGLLVTGADIPSAFQTLYALEQGCRVQVMTDSLHGPTQHIPTSILGKIPDQLKPMSGGAMRFASLVFEAAFRQTGLRYENIA